MKLIFVITIFFIAIVILIKKICRKKPQIHKDETDNSMICTSCLTGQESYIIDSSSEICPHISYLKNGKCKKYIPIK